MKILLKIKLLIALKTVFYLCCRFEGKVTGNTGKVLKICGDVLGLREQRLVL